VDMMVAFYFHNFEASLLKCLEIGRSGRPEFLNPLLK